MRDLDRGGVDLELGDVSLRKGRSAGSDSWGRDDILTRRSDLDIGQDHPGPERLKTGEK